MGQFKGRNLELRTMSKFEDRNVKLRGDWPIQGPECQYLSGDGSTLGPECHIEGRCPVQFRRVRI
jgi:hypothetical protein